MTPPTFSTGLSVGLGICEPCGAPGARFYWPVEHDLVAMPWLFGVWMCDSCLDPRIPPGRIRRERQLYSATTPPPDRTVRRR